MEEFAAIVHSASTGSEEGRRRLVGLIYPEVRRMASLRMRGERRSHTLQATALANEAMLRVLRGSISEVADLRFLYGMIARQMEQILADHARRRRAKKRGGGAAPLDLASTEVEAETTKNATCSDAIELVDALERFAQTDPRAAEIARLRVFAGVAWSEIARVLDAPLRTVERDWHFAKLWIARELERGDVASRRGTTQDPAR
jgi:RNA polymerase sigma factor (TIGR02999 family)